MNRAIITPSNGGFECIRRDFRIFRILGTRGLFGFLSGRGIRRRVVLHEPRAQHTEIAYRRAQLAPLFPAYVLPHRFIRNALAVQKKRKSQIQAQSGKCRQDKEIGLVFMLANVRFFRVSWGCLGKVKGKVRQGGQSPWTL